MRIAASLNWLRSRNLSAAGAYKDKSKKNEAKGQFFKKRHNKSLFSYFIYIFYLYSEIEYNQNQKMKL